MAAKLDGRCQFRGKPDAELPSSHRRRPVGVSEHWVEGAGEVVELDTAVVVVRRRHKTGHHHHQQQEDLQRQCGPEDTLQEGFAPGWWFFLVRMGGTGSSGVARPAIHETAQQVETLRCKTR